jgi:type II secretion system protein J
MKRSNKRHSRLGFTLIELVVAGTIAAMVLMAVTFALAQLSKTRNIARERVEAFQRASMSIEAVRRDIAAIIRTDDLFDTRFLLTTREASARTGGYERSDLLMFNISLRPIHPIEYQGEGREYETQYRVEDDELGSALWRRRDMAPDERPDGGGLAEPIADGVVGFLVEASDGEGGWRNEWDSDVDGVPKLVRVTVTATGIPVGADSVGLTPDVDLRTVIAIDRVIAPKPDPEPEEDQPASGTPAGTVAGAGGGTGGPGGAVGAGAGGGGGAGTLTPVGGAGGMPAGGGRGPGGGSGMGGVQGMGGGPGMSGGGRGGTGTGSGRPGGGGGGRGGQQ